MKISTLPKVKYALFCSIFLMTQLLVSQVPIGGTYGFEASQEGWTLNGSAIWQNHASWPCSGSYTMRTRGIASNHITSPTYDLTGYTQVDISFCHKANNNVDTGEGFTLQYYNGSSWTTLHTYARGTDFTTTGTGNSHSFSYSITPSPATPFLTNSQFRFANNADNNNERNWFDEILVEGHLPPGPEINIQGNAITIVDGDTTPSATDDTDFGSVNTVAGTNVNTFTIQNTGTASLSVGSVTIGGTNAADFTVTASPSGSVAASGSTTFNVTFNPSADGLRTANVTIVNGDGDENPYNFNIQGTGFTPAPEINLTGNGNTITDGDTTPSVTDDTDFGSVDFTVGTIVNTFTIQNTGTASLSVGAINISGANAADFTVTASPSGSVSASGSTTFNITFNPSATGLRTASVSIVNGDSNENPYNFNIQGTGTTVTYSNVTVSVDWPAYAYENTLEVYAPDNSLITTITSGGGSPFDDVFNLGCLQDLTNYYIIMYDSLSDGWDGVDNVTVTVGGSNIEINQNGNLADASGVTVYFDVYGGSSSEIEIIGNGTEIVDGDTTPTATDDTYFGNVDVPFGTNANTFTINNIGCSNLNLTGSSPYVTISGTHASDFTVTSTPSASITSGNSTTFEITFNPSAAGLRTASIRIDNDDSDENPYNFNVQGNGIVPSPEIEISGNSVLITDGDTTPDAADDTDFGSVSVTGATNPNTFTIENRGTLALTVGAITISGANAGDFTVTSSPSSSVAASGTTTFVITFDPSAVGIRNATISIANDDSDENPYNFNVRGTGTTAGVCISTVSSFPYEESFESGYGQWIQALNTIEDDFNWSRTTNSTPSGPYTGPNDAQDGTYYIFTEGNGNNNSDAILFSPCFDLSSATNPRFTFFYHMRGAGMGDLSVELSTDNGLTYPNVLHSISGETHASTYSSFTPISVDLSSYVGQTVKIRLRGETNGSNSTDMAIDMVTVEDKPTPTVAPGGVTADLALWLKADDGLSYTSGQSVTSWIDQGLGDDARVNRAGQAPTYYDNTTRNVNFNPVIEFDNSYTALNLDSDYSHDSTTTEFLSGDYGFYTQEVFIVIIPDDTPVNNSFGFMDVFCSDAQLDAQATDGTGIGFGDYTSRVTGEVIVYAHDSYDNSFGDGYAVAEIGTGSSYDNVGIINTRNNTSDTRQELYYNANNIGNTQNDLPEYMNTDDSRWWIGRSEGWEASLNARVAEVITYSSRKDDASLTQERNRIQSYLGIKYGITLGVNGTSQDYVDSSGNVIWDQSADSGNYNYDIAGIGRDDKSELNQKQSRSVNNANDDLDADPETNRTEGILTFGLSDIYNTNKLNQSENSTTLNNLDYLVWGNNGANLDLAATTVSVNMSAGISPSLTTNVSFTAMQRVWKVVENGSDIPTMKVRIPQDAIRNIVPPGDYYMFISSTGVFDPTADYRIMRSDGNGNLETDYDFDGTKYITFGYAPRVEVVRSVYFDGSVDYIDMEDALDLNPTGFTISAWIKRDAADSGNKSIISKRDAAYTQGYDFRIANNNRLHFSWKNGGSAQVISPTTRIPDDEWHHVAAIYNGTTVSIYIDGIIARTETRTPPGDTDESFYIAAAGKNSPTQHFRGNIDEVRVWDTNITPSQLRFIMNQEIEDNAAFVAGKVLPTTITKNDVGTIPWSELAGYYPMSVYTYTNTEDASGNSNQGALRNLNTVDRQTAPLPYESQSNGNWTTDATWLNNTVQTLPNAMSIVDTSEPIEWNIVRINDDVKVGMETDLGRDRQILGMYVGSGAELTIDGNNFDAGAGNGLTVSHYIKLDGKIDLEGESQFVQGTGSDLDPTSSGSLEKDQQGTADVYTYNYWSSPVGEINATTNNNDYSVTDVMHDGVNPVNFSNSGYDGSDGATITIADYWIWKFSNQPDDDYSAWQHVRQSGTILAGEGYTMKGPGSGGVVDQQNYVFLGKPNNADINLTINAGNDYLVGNPYPSAIDANKFITDNGPVIDYTDPSDDGSYPEGDPLISGTLYFWEHWGGGSHNLQEYQGGYATYNYSGGVVAPSLGTNDPDVGTGGTPSKVPGRYIPVSQGFFVVGESNGTINFNNSQRIYRKESPGTSVFVRENSDGSNANYDAQDVDDRMKFRIGFNSINTIHRQLLLTIDENTTTGYDWAFDAKTYDNQMDDLFWMIDDEKYNIQGSNEAEPESVYPLGLYTRDDGLNSITIDHLENVPDDVELYIHDLDNDSYHNLRESDFEIYLPAGEYHDRFELTFMDNSDALSTDENNIKTVDVYYDNETQNIVLLNPNFVDVKSIEMLNIIGQNITRIDNISELDYSEYEVKNLSTGAYIIKIDTLSGLISKKVLVK